MDNIGVGAAIGIALGVVVGLLLSRQRENESGDS
jgi:tetrahydromethanopterin S-methyltransferase subunit G